VRAFLNPWVILTFAVAMGGSFSYGHHKGWWERDAEMQVEIARKNDEARAKEQEMAKAVASKDEELRKANTDVAKKQTDLNRLIAAGRVRLPSPSCVQASPSATPAAGSQPEASGESDRETLRLIAEIAADGDRAINQLNACIAAYDEVRNVINGQR
jgi:hypothetical protein